ncbi:hypothetical protein [Nocardia nova]|uniref:hypothetical protein n=1 Tax=Nocardia nova TaxID=37330 RepID=UPI0033D5A6A8
MADLLSDMRALLSERLTWDPGNVERMAETARTVQAQSGRFLRDHGDELSPELWASVAEVAFWYDLDAPATQSSR